MLRGATFVRRVLANAASTGANTPWLANGSSRPGLVRFKRLLEPFLPEARGVLSNPAAIHGASTVPPLALDPVQTALSPSLPVVGQIMLF